MRSDTAFFSAADISRRFLAGLASDLLSAAAAAFVGEEERRDVERAVGADAPRICSTSVNALISAWRRSIALWRLAIACAIELMALESSDPAMGMSTRGGGRRVCHGAPATTAQDHSSLAFLDCPVQHLQCVLLTGSEGERPAGRFPAVHRRRGYAEQAGELGDRESALVA